MRRQLYNRPSMRPRLVMRPRTQNKLRHNLIIGGLALLFNASLLFAYFYFGKTHDTYAAQGWTSGSGNWNAAATWSLGRAPASGDTLTIMPGNTIVITNSTTQYTNMKIIVKGTLRLNGGRKLELCNSMVDVEAGGQILGDNSGSMVDLCGIPVWNGSMPGLGPLQIGATVLPVALAYFKAESAAKGTVNILWETASETNCNYFSVERSDDGLDFESLSKVNGAGNSNIAKRYSYTDDNPHSPVSYYRLAQVDFDGSRETFKVVSVNINPIAELTVYPNPIPAGESATVQILAGNEKTLQVSVMDAHGKKIFSQIVEKENTSDNTIYFVTEKFSAAGTYFVTASGQANKYLKKIVVL